MGNKLVKKKSTELATLERGVAKTVFSEGMGGIVASTLGVPVKRRQDFQLAYTLLPLNRAKECIDTAYYLASGDGYAVNDIQPWLKRYETLSKTELPRWAKKKSREYLRQAYKALDGESKSGLTYILYEFKGFVYAVFCRTLMERHNYEQRSDNTGEAHYQAEG